MASRTGAALVPVAAVAKPPPPRVAAAMAEAERNSRRLVFIRSLRHCAARSSGSKKKPALLPIPAQGYRSLTSLEKFVNASGFMQVSAR